MRTAAIATTLASAFLRNYAVTSGSCPWARWYKTIREGLLHHGVLAGCFVLMLMNDSARAAGNRTVQDLYTDCKSTTGFVYTLYRRHIISDDDFWPIISNK
jgi:hypothetical protein